MAYHQSANLLLETATGKGANTLKIVRATFRKLRSEAFAFLLPTLTWFAFATIYFGNPLPQSIIAKTRAYYLSPESGFIRLLQHYATPFLGHLTFGNAWIGVGFVLYLFLSLVGMRASLRATHRIWPATAYPWLYLLIFSLANPLIFRWYLTPPLPMYMLTILIGADQVLFSVVHEIRKPKGETVERVNQDERRFTTSLAMRTAIVIVVPIALSLHAWTLHPDHGLNRPAPDMAWYKLELLYERTAEYLSQEIGVDQREYLTLAAGDVGVLGYITGMHILDTVGLNSPQSTKYYPLPPDQYVINYAIPVQLIMDEKPQYLVILEVYGRASLLLDPFFQEMYEIIQTIPTDIYGSHGMLIIRRK